MHDTTKPASNPGPTRIGILGFGHLGQFLYQHLQNESQLTAGAFEFAFIWNRTKEVFNKYDQPLNQELIVDTIEEGLQRSPNLVIEVAHPDIIEKYAVKILDVCDLFVGSPTALAQASLEAVLRKKTMSSGHAIYVGAGAFWGAEDIAKMSEANTLRSLTVTMKKHPASFKLNEPLHSKLIDAQVKLGDEQGEIIVYDGPVRELCRLAPNNVNTMAVAATLASHLGFDGVRGRLIADGRLADRHVVEVELTGPSTTIGDQPPVEFHVKTVRTNPAAVGVVTGKGTLLSFLSSVKRAKGQSGGIHVV
jgi:aspartate dehydrogenase